MLLIIPPGRAFFFRSSLSIRVKELDNAAGHHVSTPFPDDDYPCCELVTSVRRGRNREREIDIVNMTLLSFGLSLSFYDHV